MHILLILLFITSVTLAYINILGWSCVTGSESNWLMTYGRCSVRNNTLSDNVSIINVLCNLQDTDKVHISSFFKWNSNIDTQFFQLNLTEYTLNQTIYNHTYMYLFKVTIFDNSSLVTDFIFSVLIATIISLFSFKVKIMF
jgi:hypothetical protein